MTKWGGMMVIRPHSDQFTLSQGAVSLRAGVYSKVTIVSPHLMVSFFNLIPPLFP